MTHYQPIQGVGHTSMKRYFPNWTANEVAESQVANQPVDDTAENSEYTDFVLSANWILRPAGLKEFYNRIRQAFENPEITYEIDIGCFRVRCRRDEQHALVTVCSEIMDELVKDEIKASPEEELLISIGTGNSNIVRYISEWRAEAPDRAELERYEAYSYPKDIAALPFKGTWKVPKDKALERIRIQSLFLGHDPAKMMSDTTGCAVASGTDGLSLHFGAFTDEKIRQAKLKMDNMLKYHGLQSQIGIQQNVIYTEDNSAVVLVELRYLAQTDRRYLRNVVLDPTKFQPEKDYEKLFEKGCFLRSMKRERGGLVPAAAVYSPAVEETKSTQPFVPFQSWKVKHKEHRWDMAGSPLCVAQTLPAVDDGRLKLVNPQAAPHVLEWATALPPFRCRSNASGDGSSITSRAEATSLEGPEDGHGSIFKDLLTIDGLQTVESAPDFVSYQGSVLQPSRAATNQGVPIHQSRSSMISCPPTTNASSFTTERRNYVPRDCRRIDGPSPNSGKCLLTEDLAGGSEAASTDSAEGEQHVDDLKAALDAMRLAAIPSISANRVIATNAQNVSKSHEESFEASDEELSGGAFSPEGDEDRTPRQETFDLLGASPPNPPCVTESQMPTPTSVNFGRQASHFNSAMSQKAPVSQPDTNVKSRKGPRAIESSTQEKLHAYIHEMLTPLRFYQGQVSLRVEIGKMWFTNINWQHITIPDMQHISKAKSIADMERSLDVHTVGRDLYFNKILSLLSGDANHISDALDADGSTMWLPDTRRAVYEFCCTAKSSNKGVKTLFTLQVDATSFEYRLSLTDHKESNVSVHCAKRDFDFRVVVDATSDIEKIYGHFAKEVVASLRVIPQGDGNIPPALECMNFREWGVAIRNVRYRQIATYKSPDNSLHLNMTHVHCMAKKTTKKSAKVWHLSALAAIGNAQAGYFPSWFEANITSRKAEQILKENQGLGFAEEATWTPEVLQESGAIDDLIVSAAQTVKHMDGVGFWVNNQQDDMRYGMPPHTRADVEEQAEARGPPRRYW